MTPLVRAVAQAQLAPGAGAVGPGSAAIEPLRPDPATVDKAGEDLVLPADATQVTAVTHVVGGGQAAVQAPPGTGGTRTMANLVAALAARGHSVLFVCEKRAVIERVGAHLDGVGLGHLILDVGAVPAPAAPLVARLLARAQDATADPPARHGGDDLRERLRSHRDRLAAHHAAMHRPRSPWGVSVADAHDALATLARRGPAVQAPICRARLSGTVLEALSRDDAVRWGRLLAQTVADGGWSGPVGDDPWFAARITSAEDAETAQAVVTRLAGGGFRSAADTLDATVTGAGLPAARTPADWAAGLDVLMGLTETLAVFDEDVVRRPLGPLLTATGDRDYRRHRVAVDGARQRWWTRWSLRRQARALVRPGQVVPDLHQALTRAQAHRDAWSGLTEAACPTRVPDVEVARRVWLDMSQDLAWLAACWTDQAAGGDLMGEPIASLEERLTRARDRLDRLHVLPLVTTRLDQLRSAGLGQVVTDLAARGVPADRVAAEVEFVWWTSVLAAVADADPDYGQHDGVALRSVVAEYVRLDEAHGRAVAEQIDPAQRERLRRVLADHPDQLRHLVDLAAGDSPAGVGAATGGRSGREATSAVSSVHDLLAAAPELARAAAPCWAMSPVAVASVVPASVTFDVVIVGEASRLPVSHAVSALARAGRVVAVGDSAQLPPLPFRTAAVDAEVTPVSDDLVTTQPAESVLDVVARFAPTCTLTWHDGVADERLVQFANAHSFGGTLSTLPAASGLSPIRLVQVGAGEPVTDPSVDDVAPDDGAGSPDREVARVVRVAIDHAVRRPTESLAVVTLGLHHANRIEQALRAALSTHPDPAVVAFFGEGTGRGREPFVVLPVERAQGEYRDAVILALGLERTADGRVPYRLGRLSASGGQRWLTVATTRARRRMVVVSAFGSSDFDRPLAGTGAQLLVDYLAAADDPVVVEGAALPPGPAPSVRSADAAGGPDEQPGGRPPDDPLMGELASRLRHEGLVVRQQFGAGSLPIGLAVDDPYAPGRPIVAVESDGAEYAAMLAVRDRERLRPEQLRRLGWQPVRVWGTDVFRDPARDVARVVEAVRSCDARSGWSATRVDPGA